MNPHVYVCKVLRRSHEVFLTYARPWQVVSPWNNPVWSLPFHSRSPPEPVGLGVGRTVRVAGRLAGWGWSGDGLAHHGVQLMLLWREVRS